MPDFAEGFHSIHAADIEHVGRVWLRDGTSDPYVFNQIFQTEEFNISTAPQFAWVRAAYDRTLAAGEVPLVIDCGANIGLSSLYFAKHLPKARIVGIEPEPENVALARRNTQSHPRSRSSRPPSPTRPDRCTSSIPRPRSTPIRSARRATEAIGIRP